MGLLLVWALGCASQAPTESPAPVAVGDETVARSTEGEPARAARPATASLPELAAEPTDVTLPESELGAEHPAWRAWREALADRLERPTDFSAEALNRWAATQQAWVRRRNELHRGVFTEFATVIGGGTDVRTETDAAMGLLIEDQARQLLAIPVPDELGGSTRDRYLTVFWDFAVPVLEAVDDFYRDCAERADNGSAAWRQLCAARRENLRAHLRGPIQLYERMSPDQWAAARQLMRSLREARTQPGAP